MLQEQLFELKNEETIEKFENLRDICTSQGLFLNTIMSGPFQSCEAVSLTENNYPIEDPAGQSELENKHL